MPPFFELQDRYEDALAAANRSLEVRPWYRPAVQAAGRLLLCSTAIANLPQLILDRGHAAFGKAVRWPHNYLHCSWNSFNIPKPAQLSTALKSFGRCSKNTASNGSPRTAGRGRLSFGRHDGSIHFAEQSQSDFFKFVAENLKQAERATKPVLLLPVGFVRQHHVTCGPATLSAISRYWSMPADHLQVAEEICYDGTPAHSERLWADRTNGSSASSP